MCEIRNKIIKLKNIVEIFDKEREFSFASHKLLREGEQIAISAIRSGERLVYIRNSTEEKPKCRARKDWELALSDWDDWKSCNEKLSYIFEEDGLDIEIG